MTHPRTILSCASALAALLALSALPLPASGDDPERVYRTIRTRHFRVHFHQGLEELARETADVAEEVHADLTTLFGWEVDGPTDVVLTDGTDDANGSANPSPRPVVRLYASPPSAGSSLSHHDDWVRMLFVHEYTHIVHLQMHGGFSRAVNAIFGDVYLPNQMQPLWFIEAMTIMQETYRTTGGRIRSSHFRAAIRVNALEGKLLSLGEVSNDVRQYPRGNTPYIYGAMFIDWLRTRFGEEKIYAICREYGSNALPYGMNRTFRRVLGVDLVTLYDEWRAAVTEEARATAAEVEAKGSTRAARLTRDGESKGQPVFSRTGGGVLLSIANGEARSGIFEVPLGGGARRLLALSGGDAHLSTTRRGDLFYTRSAPHRRVYRYSDVFALPAAGGGPVRLTHGARAREAAVSPSGREIAMAVVGGGRTRLVIADERGSPRRELVAPGPGDQVYAPAWSPDGRSLVVVARHGPATRLEIRDAATGALVRTIDEAGHENDPVFDPSGRWVVFSSDRTGIANIHAFDLDTGELRQLTNVVGGAVGPAVSWDGRRLAFLDVSSSGYDLYTTDFAPAAAPVVERRPPPPAAPARKPAPARASVGPYNPLPSLVPASWMLGARFTTGGSLIQATTAKGDAVGHHAVAAGLYYGLEGHTFSVSAAYAYTGMTPSLHLGVSHRSVPREDGYLVGGVARAWDQSVTSASVALAASVAGNDRSHSLSVSYNVLHAAPEQDLEIELDPSGALPDIPTQYFRAGLDFGWSYSDTVSSPFGISPEKGRAVWASAGIDHPALGSDLRIASFGYGWTEYVEAPWLDHHVFALRVSGGIYVSDPPEQAAMYLGGYSEQNLVDALWNNVPQGLPSLRGYPANAFAGDQAHVGHLEYRFPIWWFEAAYKTVPLFLRELHAAVFTDQALITFDALGREAWSASVGAELVWSLRFGYYMPITIRLGYARGLMDRGVNEVIAVFGNTF